MGISFKEIVNNHISYDNITRGKGWFSLRDVLSYNRFLNVITAQRTAGKSTAGALYFIMEYIRTGKGWVYSRRTDDETGLTADTWFDNACTILNREVKKWCEENDVDPSGKECHIAYKAGHYYYYEGPFEEKDEEGNDVKRKDIYDIECGRAIPLSLQWKHKGGNFSKYDFLIYDEFVAFGGFSYLGGTTDELCEYRSLMSLFQTMDRDVDRPYRNEVKIFCFGNNDSYNNPIYKGMGAEPFLRTDARWIAPKDKIWVIHQIPPGEISKLKDYKESNAYKLADEYTKKYAFENQNKENGDAAFVKKLKVSMAPVFNGIFDGYKMCVYQYARGFYVQPGINGAVHTFALTHSDHKPDVTLPTGMYGFPLQQFKKAYSDCMVTFENKKCKNCWESYFKFIK